jgi:ABC-2 type transport system permease protein
MMIPMFLNPVFTESPHSSLAVILSLFPLTAPTAMLPRIAGGGVSFWQAAMGLVGLVATTYVFVGLAARFFRADTLLSSAALSWKRLVTELRK